MVFSSLIFIFGFFPLCIFLAFITCRWIRIQNAILLIISIFFYAWGEPKNIWLFLLTILLNWFLVLIADTLHNRQIKKGIGISAIIFDLIILFLFKYARWIGDAFGLTIGSTTLPIGISFYTFQAISYVADVTLLEKYKAQKNLIDVALYIAFFPQLIAGPIIRYEKIRNQIVNHKCEFFLSVPLRRDFFF